MRKISYGEGVERVFPLYSPRIGEIEVVRRGDVRRAKLYYLRDRPARRPHRRGHRGPARAGRRAGRGGAKRPRREKLKKEKPKAEGSVRAAKGGGKK